MDYYECLKLDHKEKFESDYIPGIHFYKTINYGPYNWTSSNSMASSCIFYWRTKEAANAYLSTCSDYKVYSPFPDIPDRIYEPRLESLEKK